MLPHPTRLDTIVHIGAGRGLDLGVHLNSPAKRILLVEPNPVLAQKLRDCVSGEARVDVLEAAISPDEGLTTLTEFNIPEAASLYPPEGLYRLFPNLRAVASHEVRRLAPRELLRRHAPECVESRTEAHHWLVIQAPGAEQAVVKALQNEGLLGNFRYLHVISPKEAYYQSGSAADAVLSIAEEAGFELRDAEESDPDWPEWHLVLDHRARQIKELEAEISRLNAEHRRELAAERSSRDQLIERMELLFDRQGRQLEQLTEALQQCISGKPFR